MRDGFFVGMACACVLLELVYAPFGAFLELVLIVGGGFARAIQKENRLSDVNVFSFRS